MEDTGVRTLDGRTAATEDAVVGWHVGNGKGDGGVEGRVQGS
jgi:hypothetical protein